MARRPVKKYGPCTGTKLKGSSGPCILNFTQGLGTEEKGAAPVFSNAPTKQKGRVTLWKGRWVACWVSMVVG